MKFLMLIVALLASRGDAFAPVSETGRMSTARRVAPSPTDFDVQPMLESLQHSSHMLLCSGNAAEKTGAWQSYLQIFKNTLSWVHSTIEGPAQTVGVTQTWGLSIAIFTAMVRSALIPLSIQQSKSSEYIKALKPYTNEIKKKYKNNKDAQNAAIAKLYEDADQNPLAGCAVSLAQLPIFLGLYRGVRLLAQEGKLDEPFLWIPSLEGPVSPPNFQGMDWLTSGWNFANEGLPTPPLGWETTVGFLIMPLTLVLLQTLTMKVLQPAMDEDASDEERETLERTQGILKFLPLMIGFFSLQVPAALTIYWFTSNIFTLMQSLGVRAYFAANPPDIELPDYWENVVGEEKDFDSMTPEERRKAAAAGIGLGPTWQDMQDEAAFHTFIERRSFRRETEAWKRATASSSSGVPAQMQAWVGKTEIVESEAATA